MDKRDILTFDDAQTCVEQVRDAALLYLDSLPDTLSYHAREHTTGVVVPAMERLMEKSGIIPRMLVLGGIAAWKHDTGFRDMYWRNEPIGAAGAILWMNDSEWYFNKFQREAVAGAIMVTDLTREPENLMEQFMRDSDLAYIGFDTNKFLEIEAALPVEVAKHKPLDRADPEACHMMYDAATNGTWPAFSYGFMRNFHKWYSDAAIVLFGAQKQRNLQAFVDTYDLQDLEEELAAKE